jgi:glucose/arabinose dehydrogenase
MSFHTLVARRARTALFVIACSTWLAACGGGDMNGDGNGSPPPSSDTTAPSIPGSVTASAQSSSEVVVSWEASSDAGTGVAGYHIFRDGGSTPIATVNDATSYTDTGLAANTQYTYAVSAFDSASPANESSKSGGVLVTTPPSSADEELKLTVEPAFASLPAFHALVLALQAPGDASTWYAVEQSGRVLAFDNSPDVASTRTFIDISSRVESGGEAGLLGMAFHPGYPTNPRVYLSYTAQVGADLISRVSEFRTNDGGSTLDASTEQILFKVDQPAANHNGGNVAFGPDGLLYIGFGDGGGHDDEWPPIGNGQNLETLLGKMVRIDVDGTTGAVPYRIPPDNPFSNSSLCDQGQSAVSQSCPEIYAYGFRNPWRWSFDLTTADLWVGDVGQAALEEVDSVTLGGNYGWRCYEGTDVHNLDCGLHADSSLPPIAQYTHAAGNAVTGGYVYRGTAIPGLAGRYVFGDYGSGRLWHIARTTRPTKNVTTSSAAADTGLLISSFAQDTDGELYVLDYGGTIYRLIEAGNP